MFDRNPVIGNSLEPALTSANIILQTILGPPFEWWWNSEEISFTCNPTPQTATITNIAISGGVLTVTCNNTFASGNQVISTNVGTYTNLNGFLLTVVTSSSTQFTATVPFADYGPAADTGTMTNTTTQDTTTPTPEFSHIDHVALLDINPNPNKWLEIEVKNVLSQDSTQDRPRFISPHSEDGNGNMTWRVMPSPDKAYPINIHIMKAAPQITSVNQTWAPLPDYMQYIYSWGFMSLMWTFSDEPVRAATANQKFIAGLLARAEGITEEERNTFLNAWGDTVQTAGIKMQQGIQARGV